MFDLADELKKRMVWAKGTLVPGYDPNEWRSDAFGFLMRYSDYGDRQSSYGWEFDHEHPSRLGGLDHIDNLRPLHCRKNASLGGLLSGLLRD